MSELLTLKKKVYENGQLVESTRDVLCELHSIGLKEFYAANATDIHPEAKFVLADYLDYDGEALAKHSGQWYRVLRTYRVGQALELTVERASAEEAGENGQD